MEKFKLPIIATNFFLVLCFFNWEIFKKENILKKEQIILLELAPIDPRSFLQGDYMNLNYAVSQKSESEKIPKRGFLVIQIGEDGVGKKIRFQEFPTPVAKDEHIIKYYSSNKFQIRIGAESYFFQEGEREKFSEAKYGGLKVADDGTGLLIGVYDENRKRIE